MGALTQAGLFGAIICLVAMLFALYKKNPLWKNYLFGVVLCLLIFFAGLTIMPMLQERVKPVQDLPTAPLLKYELQSINAPSQREVDAWRKGLLCALTYNVLVEKEQPSEEEFKTIALDIIEKDAKKRGNWNVVYLYLHTPASLKTAVAELEGIYALNGKIEQTNRIKPGTYNNNYRLVISKAH